MGLSLAVFGCRKPKKCSKSKLRKTHDIPLCGQALYRLSLSCPARSPLRSALRICCTEPVPGSQVSRVWRSNKEAKMRNVWSGKRSLGIFVKFVKSWSFTDDKSYLFVYIGNVWHFSSLIPKFLQYMFLVRDRRPFWLMKQYTIFFSRNLNEKEFSSQRWETLFVRVNICGHRDVSLKPAMVMWSLQY